MRIKDIATLPRRVQPVRHIISRKRRHREMQERRDEFEKMVEREKKVVRTRKMMKNVECPYCHDGKERKVLESGQCSHGKPLMMLRFKCETCDRYFWKHEKVQK